MQTTTLKRLLTTFVLAMIGTHSALAAAPVITSVATSHSLTGAPTGLTLFGTGFPCSTCAAPTVTAGTTTLTVTSQPSTTELIVALPSGFGPGSYLLTVVIPPGGAANTATYDLSIPPDSLLEGHAGSIWAGIGAMSNATGDADTAFGSVALNKNTTGDGNSAFGVRSLSANTTGRLNSAVGEFALQQNTTGSSNTAMGVSALAANTTADGNTAIGYGALNLQSFSNGGTEWETYNTAVGYQALLNNAPTSTTTGADNTALGDATLSPRRTMPRTTCRTSVSGCSAVTLIRPAGRARSFARSVSDVFKEDREFLGRRFAE